MDEGRLDKYICHNDHMTLLFYYIAVMVDLKSQPQVHFRWDCKQGFPSQVTIQKLKTTSVKSLRSLDI